MESIISKDGTRIAYQRSGQGPPLILVHGTSATHTRWRAVSTVFEKYFTVYAMDRRGRGESGDAEPYTLQLEFDDLAALAEHIGEPVFLLGHSYGAICALEASRLTSHISKLILYEPPINTSVEVSGDEDVQKLEALLAQGDKEGVVTTFMKEIVRMPEHEFKVFKASPAFPARVASAHTIPRELRHQANYRFIENRFSEMKTPVLLLLGGDSPVFFKLAIESLSGTLPNSRVVVLEGQQHIAIDTAPGLFTEVVLKFLSNTEVPEQIGLQHH